MPITTLYKPRVQESLLRASHQNAPVIKASQQLQEFQVWILKFEDDKSCHLTCAENSDVASVIIQDIEFTNFPLKEIKLHVCGNVILLPSEYQSPRLWGRARTAPPKLLH